MNRMKKLIHEISLRANLVLIFASLSFFISAQTKENNKELLQGKWIYEDAYIPDDEHPMSFDLYNTSFKFYDEIEVKEDVVSLTDSEKTQRVKYEAEGNALAVDLSSGEPLTAEWVIQDDKLYLEFSCLHPYEESKKVNLWVVYIKK